MNFKEYLKNPIFICAAALFCTVCLVIATVFFSTSPAVQTGTSSTESSTSLLEQSSTITSSDALDSSTLDTSSKEKIITFKITSPSSKNLTVTDSFCVFRGTCDPKDALIIAGQKITPSADGHFSCDINLNVGKNSIVVEHGNSKATYNVNYRYIVLKDYSPSKAASFEGGSTMVLRATARYGSTVTATFNGQKITLKQEFLSDENKKPEFIGYIGSYDLPKGTATSKSLGPITFTAKHNSVTETFKSQNITLKKNPIVQNDGSVVTPVGGQYMNVGSGYIAEIVCDSAETFDGRTVDDMSRPTNNYLPKGTVDYCSTTTVKDSASGRIYRKLRCGKRVYEEVDGDKTKKFVKTYVGKLPERNNLNINYYEDTGRYTIISLKTDWKAPFYFNLLPLNYYNAQIRDYRFDSATYSFIDITFCYADRLTFAGTADASKLIGENNPIFSSAQIIKNKNDCTLRLHLRNKGKFYGWSAEYDNSGCLVFKFLHPTFVSATNRNPYGVDLSNATVFIDAGHGGNDPGAVGTDGRTTEANLNLSLAMKIKAELEKTGCHVIIDRIDNVSLESEDRIKMLKKSSPDLVISVHRNANNYSSVHGYNTYYFHPYSREANQFVFDSTMGAGLYDASSYSKVAWHYFFLGRVTDCPVILAENGYLTNSKEFSKIKNDAFNKQCAIATTEGIVKYFLKNSPVIDKEDDTSSTTSNNTDNSAINSNISSNISSNTISSSENNESEE